MALSNRPMTAAEMKTLLDNKFMLPLQSEFMQLLQEALENPTPHTVRYSADIGVTYTSPKEFYIGCRKHLSLPSDCEWHIPGSERKGF